MILNKTRSTVAYQKAQYAYKRLNKIVKDEEYPKAFEFHNQGSMAYIGDWFVLTILHHPLPDAKVFVCG